MNEEIQLKKYLQTVKWKSSACCSLIRIGINQNTIRWLDIIIRLNHGFSVQFSFSVRMVNTVRKIFFFGKNVFLSLKYCKSVTFILHVSFGANQPLNYLNWCMYHPHLSLTMMKYHITAD
jgi:hypothetical protein